MYFEEEERERYQVVEEDVAVGDNVKMKYSKRAQQRSKLLVSVYTYVRAQEYTSINAMYVRMCI